MPIAMDASWAVAIVLQELPAQRSGELREIVAVEGAVVPAIWRFEVANALLMASRRGRLPPSEIAAALADFSAMPIDLDRQSIAGACSSSLAFAERHRLTVYDAAYLELAIRLGLRLATLDGELARAATREGVEVIGA